MHKFLLSLVVASAAFPAAAAPIRYEIDPTHTFPSLEFPHMGISMWRGKFDRSRGSILIDRAAKTGTVDIVVDTASINFGLAEMDHHARGKDWFDVAQFPTATYKGVMRFKGDVPDTVDGSFTFRGITKPVQLVINSLNCIVHPMLRKEVCGADAEGELNWSEYGMSKSEYGKGEAGKVRLRIQVEALKQD